MQSLNSLKSSILRLSSAVSASLPNKLVKRFKTKPPCEAPCSCPQSRKSPCDIHCVCPVAKRPCFDLRNVTIEPGNQCHTKLIRSFLYTQYWPREPSVIGLWMPIDSPYLEILTEKYAHSGDRLVAFEKIKRTGEQKLIGVCVANRVYPWMIDELEEWAHYTTTKPERYRMYFCAHCLRSPNLFKKYNVEYIYDIEVLGTAAEVAGQGVGTLLLQSILTYAQEARHTVAQVVSLSAYTSKMCEKCGMKREWTMDYTEFVDDSGQRVFFPRRPHHTVSLYVKYFDPKKGGKMKCVMPKT